MKSQLFLGGVLPALTIVFFILTLAGCTGGNSGADATIAAQNAQIATLASRQSTGEITPSSPAMQSTPFPTTERPSVQQPIPATPLSQAITTEPNLKLYAQDIRKAPLGSGLQRITVLLSGENASSGWHSYSIKQEYHFTTQCMLNLRNPVLHTKEGYEYNAATNSDSNCSIGITYDIPPGLVVTSIGNTFSTAQRFGGIVFDVAEAVSPVSITVSYQAGLPLFTEPFGMKTTIIDLGAPYDGPMPFDPAYSETIYHPGETIEIGKAATMIAGKPQLNQSSLTIPFTVSSRNGGYPLKSRLNVMYLVNQAGDLCCGQVYTGQIGPLQSWETQGVFDSLPAGKYWLVGGIDLQEVSPAKTETKSTWVVEIDVSASARLPSPAASAASAASPCTGTVTNDESFRAKLLQTIATIKTVKRSGTGQDGGIAFQFEDEAADPHESHQIKRYDNGVIWEEVFSGTDMCYRTNNASWQCISRADPAIGFQDTWRRVIEGVYRSGGSAVTEHGSCIATRGGTPCRLFYITALEGEGGFAHQVCFDLTSYFPVYDAHVAMTIVDSKTTELSSYEGWYRDVNVPVEIVLPKH